MKYSRIKLDFRLESLNSLKSFGQLNKLGDY